MSGHRDQGLYWDEAPALPIEMPIREECVRKGRQVRNRCLEVMQVRYTEVREAIARPIGDIHSETLCNGAFYQELFSMAWFDHTELFSSALASTTALRSLHMGLENE